MKKILAIAVASAIAAPAMADMTISGTVAAGYSSSTAAYTSDATTYSSTTTGTATVTRTSDAGKEGFGIDTAAISIKGSETLDNGLTVSGSMSAGGFTRGGDVGGENASLAVSGDFGSFSITAAKVSSHYINVVGGADNFAGELTGESTVDIVKYALPAMGPVAAYVSNVETVGVGTGLEGGNKFNPEVGAKVTLSDAASVFAAYRFYEGDTTNNRVRLGGNYDAGVVQVSAGYEKIDAKAANSDETVTSFGIAVPAGAATLAASYVATKTEGSDTLAGTSLSATTALSSNLSAQVKYNAWDSTSTTDENSVSAILTLSF